MPTAFELNVERWAKHAYLILRDEVARHYHATITYSDLANRVLVVSKSKQTTSHHWLGRVLSLVIKACHMRGEPPLTSLVVHKHDGMVGNAYDEVLLTRGDAAPADPDAREAIAAKDRLECYRHFGATIPEGGGEPAYSAIFLARQRRQSEPREPSRQRQSRPTTPARETKFCPRCFLALPATGICDNCD